MADTGTPPSRHGPILRKAPGPVGWVDVRGRGLGSWAFALNRITGLGLVFYLYLHLAVLFLLTRGEGAWERFLELARTPFFLGLDVLLIAGILVHGLNGIRVGLVGTGVVPNRHEALLWATAAIGAVVLVYSILHIVGSA
jgi:succinate dehydrogenase / fumarate reductase cytochrome b subunit